MRIIRIDNGKIKEPRGELGVYSVLRKTLNKILQKLHRLVDKYKYIENKSLILHKYQRYYTNIKDIAYKFNINANKVK